MSHELRTPLNAVLGFAQLIEMGVKPEMDRARAGQIVTAGRHLLAMINDVLDLSRIEAGQLALSLERVDAGACLAESLALVRTMAADAQVTLSAPALATGSLFVRADAVRLRQVMVNLLTNAIKYNVAGGRVTVNVARADGQAHLSVADTGRGLTADQVAHLFEPFNRLGAELSRVEGTGIGLTVSRDLIRLMSGRIDVESRPAHGSIFTVVLPCDGADCGQLPAAAPAAPPRARAATGDLHDVLYVEDNEVNVLVAQHALAMLPGLELRIARRGAEALVAVRTRRPDLILLDMHLGDMLGTELKVQLDAVPATAGIPCMAVSADAMPEQIAEVRAQGFVDYVTKPFDVDDLLRRVEAVLRRRP
jgi:CheY-like chemotaxis protein